MTLFNEPLLISCDSCAGGGDEEGVPAYTGFSADEINPVRVLCKQYGIDTRLSDGNSTYVGESDAGLQSILFYGADGKELPEEEVDDLWSVYDGEE